MEVTRETSPAGDLAHGQIQVGLTPVQLCNSFRTNRGVLLRTPGTSDPNSNSACVWVGNKTVTPWNGVNPGMSLPPGQAIVIPIDDPSKLYIVSTSADQTITWMGV